MYAVSKNSAIQYLLFPFYQINLHNFKLLFVLPSLII